MEQSTWSAAGVPRQIFLFIMLSLLVVSVYHFGGQFTETLEACPSVPTAVEEPAPTTEAPATQKPAASQEPAPASQAPAPTSQAPTAPTEAPVVAASWLPASIPPCLHQVFSKYAYPPRKPTPAEFRVAGIDHIYVIHWTPLTERLKTMAARFSRVLKAGWEEQNYVTFVNQYDARTIPDRDLVCLAGPKHYRLANGTLSVTTKHHFAYYDALVNNYSVIMLLEDDADFTGDFESEMTKIMSALAKVPNWGNCMVSGGRFSGHGTEPYIDPAPSGEGSRFAYGYLVSTLGATQLLGNIPIRDNPDWQMNFAAREIDFKSYFSRANPVFEVPDDKDGSWVSSKRK